MKKRLLIVSAILLTLNLIAAAQSIVPVTGVPPTLTSVTINASTGDQFDPHISGDWVAYTSDIGLRYYNFATNTDAAIPTGSSLNDLLSDISGSTIVFSRVTVEGTSLMVFDAATPGIAPFEIDPVLSPNRFGSAIGGNTVAYIDFGLQANGELVVSDLITHVTTRITNDTVADGNASVSPDGNVVVWEHCTASITNCDIWQAVKTGGAWNVSVVSDTTSPEGNPDTNGTLVVYDSHRGTNEDVFWRSVGSAAETQLQIPSFDGNPSIAGNYIAFEGRASVVDAADIFVYDIVNNKLYQITNTPLVNEQLNDITLLPNCDVRTVWSSDEDGADKRNIKAATFTLSGCDTTPPVLDPISNIVVTLPPNSTATSMPVTFPLPTATDDSGMVTVTTSPVSGAVFQLGKTTVNVTATDPSNNTDTGSFTVTVLHNFSGFLQPVDDLPIVNVVNAGQAVPVKFSLSGNKGLNIFAAGYPASGQVACDASDPGSVIEETVSAGGSSLSYNAAADQYSYIWKTEKAWKGTCRILALRLNDGSDHFANFRFR